MSETVTVVYMIGEEEHKYVLDSRKTWKGKLIRGYDVAELIVHDIWNKADKYPTTIEIMSPAAYKGSYQIGVVWEPTFSAKRVDNAA